MANGRPLTDIERITRYARQPHTQRLLTPRQLRRANQKRARAEKRARLAALDVPAGPGTEAADGSGASSPTPPADRSQP